VNARAIRGAACCAMTVGMLFIGTAGASAAATYTVSGFSDSASGSCNSADVCTTLRWALAVAAANPPSTVQLAAGTYTLSDGELEVDSTYAGSGNAVTLTGAGSGATVIKQTVAGDRVLDLLGDTSPYLISNLEITGGNANSNSPNGAFGGGIYSASDQTTLTGVLLTGNSATGLNGTSGTTSAPGGNGGEAAGGGYYDYNDNDPGTAITDSTITANTATGGTGGIAGSISEPAGTGDYGWGGGIFLAVGDVSDSTIAGNTAAGGAGGTAGAGETPGEGSYGYGGGIGFEELDALEVTDSTIVSNTAAGGAGGKLLGGAGGGNGSSGDGSGGGIGGDVDDGGLDLFGDTIAANAATGTDAFGGDLYYFPEGVEDLLRLQDTVIADGTATQGGDCELALTQNIIESDGGNNLESDSNRQCGLGVGDVLGEEPELGPLAENGGPTETELPQAGSPLIRTGSTTCQAYVSPANETLTSLTSDQRGEPDGAACDIGAVQLQAAAGSGAATLIGTASVGDTLTCSIPSGTFSGDELSYTYTWLRGGSAIPGAGSSSYTLTAADAGQKVSCQVAATGLVGTAVDVASPGVAIPAVSTSTSPTPTPSPSPSPVSGTIGLTSKRLSYAHGKVKFELRCTGGQTGCSGRYELYVVKHHGKKTTDVVLAKGTYSLTSGKTKTTNVKPKLSKSESATLRKRHGKLSTVFELTPTGRKAGKTKTTVEG